MSAPLLSELLAWLRRAPAALNPVSLSRLPDPGLTLRAVLHDLWRQYFGQAPDADWIRGLQRLYLPAADPERQLCAGLLLGLWLLQAPALQSWLQRDVLENILSQDYLPLLQAMPAQELLKDLERQEELARFWLRALGIQPLDESPQESLERWEQVSSQRQQDLFAQLRQRRRRDQAVRQAQQRKQQQW